MYDIERHKTDLAFVVVTDAAVLSRCQNDGLPGIRIVIVGQVIVCTCYQRCRATGQLVGIGDCRCRRDGIARIGLVSDGGYLQRTAARRGGIHYAVCGIAPVVDGHGGSNGKGVKIDGQRVFIAWLERFLQFIFSNAAIGFDSQEVNSVLITVVPGLGWINTGIGKHLCFWPGRGGLSAADEDGILVGALATFTRGRSRAAQSCAGVGGCHRDAALHVVHRHLLQMPHILHLDNGDLQLHQLVLERQIGLQRIFLGKCRPTDGNLSIHQVRRLVVGVQGLVVADGM